MEISGIVTTFLQEHLILPGFIPSSDSLFEVKFTEALHKDLGMLHTYFLNIQENDAI